jgi:hypothetical protein
MGADCIAPSQWASTISSGFDASEFRFMKIDNTIVYYLAREELRKEM